MQNEANWAEKNMKISIFDYFFKLEFLDMLGIADYDSSNGSGLFHSHSLPISMAKLCKIGLFFNLVFLNIVDIAEYDVKYDVNSEVEHVPRARYS